MRRFQRARQPDEKEARRRAILVAARKLVREVGPIELSLNQLGRSSGVSKPNIYRYFESREEILLRLLVEELDDLVAEVEGALADSDGDGEVRLVAGCVVRAYLSRPLAGQLLGIASSVLEHNLSPTAIAAAKRELVALTRRVAAALARSLAWLTVTDAAWAARSIALYVAGMWPAAHPSRTAAEVLKRAEFAAVKLDAASDLARFVEVLLSGLEATRLARRRRR